MGGKTKATVSCAESMHAWKRGHLFNTEGWEGMGDYNKEPFSKSIQTYEYVVTMYQKVLYSVSKEPASRKLSCGCFQLALSDKNIKGHTLAVNDKTGKMVNRFLSHRM